MKKTKEVVSVRQEAVWRMKEKTYEETRHLNAKGFFQYINDKCKNAVVGGKRHATASAR